MPTALRGHAEPGPACPCKAVGMAPLWKETDYMALSRFNAGSSRRSARRSIIHLGLAVERPRPDAGQEANFLIEREFHRVLLANALNPTDVKFAIIGHDSHQHRPRLAQRRAHPRIEIVRAEDLLIADAESLSQGRVIEPRQDRRRGPQI